MGPYCKFCDTRCFCHLPTETPEEARKALGNITILATCPAGKALELGDLGWNIDTIWEEIEQRKGAP